MTGPSHRTTPRVLALSQGNTTLATNVHHLPTLRYTSKHRQIWLTWPHNLVCWTQFQHLPDDASLAFSGNNWEHLPFVTVCGFIFFSWCLPHQNQGIRFYTSMWGNLLLSYMDTKNEAIRKGCQGTPWWPVGDVLVKKVTNPNRYHLVQYGTALNMMGDEPGSSSTDILTWFPMSTCDLECSSDDFIIENFMCDSNLSSCFKCFPKASKSKLFLLHTPLQRNI